jgi:hypothetical protein
MKQTKILISGIVLSLLIAVLSVPFMTVAVDELDWKGILPGISTEAGGTYAINVAYTASTVGWDVSEATSTTNALYEVESVTVTSTGTPAIGLGAKKTWTVETTADHNEDIGYIGFQISDETLDTEDGDFVIGNMAGGSAAATKWTLGSTGITTMVGGATLDNTTAATELLITETNVQISGALDLEGGNVKINEDSGDYDFAVETDSTDNAFSIDSGNSTLETNGVTITHNQGGADVDFIVESDDDTAALKVDAGDDSVQIGAFTEFAIQDIAAATYTVDLTSRATIYSIDYTTTGTVAITLDTDLFSKTGRVLYFYDEDGNAGTNNITISTEGSETINGAATYVMNANNEAIMLVIDGTNAFVLSALGE